MLDCPAKMKTRIVFESVSAPCADASQNRISVVANDVNGFIFRTLLWAKEQTCNSHEAICKTNSVNQQAKMHA
jgi:hypothetical protein